MENMPNQTHQPIQPGTPPATAPTARTPWPVAARERRLAPLALGLSFLTVCVLLGWLEAPGLRLPGLGMTLLAALYCAVVLLYCGTAGLQRRACRWLLAAAALLAATFALFSNQWFRFWNSGALLLLLAVWTWELCGGARLPWDRAGMLMERLGLLVRGPFVRLGALWDTLATLGKSGAGRWLPVLAGLGLALPAIWVVTLVLMDADAVFALLAGDAMDWLGRHFGRVFWRLLLALCALPFCFSLLYFAAHTQAKDRPARQRKARDPLPAAMLLGALDGLYLLFLGVQSAALFGGEAYLAPQIV